MNMFLRAGCGCVVLVTASTTLIDSTTKVRMIKDCRGDCGITIGPEVEMGESYNIDLVTFLSAEEETDLFNRLAKQLRDGDRFVDIQFALKRVLL